MIGANLANLFIQQVSLNAHPGPGTVVGTFVDINKTVLVSPLGLTAEITTFPNTARCPCLGDTKVSLSQALKGKDDLCEGERGQHYR